MTAEERVIMVTLGCSAAQAHAEYAQIEGILINLAHPVPIRGGLVTATTLNVRQTPGVNAKAIGSLAQGTAVEIWGQTPTGDWLCIAEPCGWVAAQWVSAA
jgi:uncharacterized protein YraI